MYGIRARNLNGVQLSRSGKLTACDDQIVCVNKLRVKTNYGWNKEDWSRFELNHVASSHENERSQMKIDYRKQNKKDIQSDDDNTFKSNFNGRIQ